MVCGDRSVEEVAEITREVDVIVFLRSRRDLALRQLQSRELIRFDVDGGSFRSGGARLNTLAVVDARDDRFDDK